MNLDKVNLVIRPRKGFEAIDLGFKLAQQHIFTLYKIWTAISLPLFLVIILLMHHSPWWAVTTFWWLIPLMERPLLYFLSRKIFAEHLSVKTCIGQFWPLAKIQWLASLTWRRLSLTRAVDLPVILLEQLSGETRSQRVRVIHAMDQSASFWLTFVIVLCELILLASSLALIYLLTPDIYRDSLHLQSIFLGEWSLLSKSLFFGFVYLAFSFFAPFYTAAGFTLYLNQRTRLESWDLELAFRRLAERLRKLNTGSNVKLACTLVALLISSVIPIGKNVEAAAQSTPRFTQQVRQELDDILSRDEFHQKAKDYRYQLRFEPEAEKSESNSGLMAFLAGLFSGIARLTEILLWIALISGAVFLLWRYGYLLMPDKRTRKRSLYVPPKNLFGLDLNSDSLPKDPNLTALHLINSGDYRAGVSLLYRAALIWFITMKKPELHRGDTELECLQKILPLATPEQQRFMQQLTQNWRRLAYAHEPIHIDELRVLCQSWPFANDVLVEQQG